MHRSNAIIRQTQRCKSRGVVLSAILTENSVTCDHCRTQLAIHRTTTVSQTRALNQIARRTHQLTEQVRCLTWRNAVDALDREWEREKETYMQTGKSGRRYAPSRERAFIMALFLVVPAILLILAGLVDAESGHGIFGLVFLVLGIYLVRRENHRANAWERALQNYILRRASLTRDNVRIYGDEPRTNSTKR